MHPSTIIMCFFHFLKFVPLNTGMLLTFADIEDAEFIIIKLIINHINIIHTWVNKIFNIEVIFGLILDKLQEGFERKERVFGCQLVILILGKQSFLGWRLEEIMKVLLEYPFQIVGLPLLSISSNSPRLSGSQESTTRTNNIWHLQLFFVLIFFYFPPSAIQQPELILLYKCANTIFLHFLFILFINFEFFQWSCESSL